MANMGLLIGILIVIVIIAIAAVVLTSKGGIAGGNGPQLINGSAGTLSYQTTSAAGADSQSLTTPEGNGYFFCLQASWNATSYAGGVGAQSPYRMLYSRFARGYLANMQERKAQLEL